MIDSILKITHGCGFDEAIRIKDGETLEVTIRKEDGERLELLSLPHISVGDDGWREPCEPVFVRVMIDIAKGGQFDTEETKRRVAIEEERRCCANVLAGLRAGRGWINHKIEGDFETFVRGFERACDLGEQRICARSDAKPS